MVAKDNVPSFGTATGSATLPSSSMESLPTSSTITSEITSDSISTAQNNIEEGQLQKNTAITIGAAVGGGALVLIVASVLLFILLKRRGFRNAPLSQLVKVVGK